MRPSTQQPAVLLLLRPNVNTAPSEHCCQFDSETELMTLFDARTRWQCSFGDEEAVDEGRLGSNSQSPLRVECPRGGGAGGQ
ncbi:hypothetical protein F2P81_008635 [Scophthalmus maximus]|uniref:Uncharacterized protein n=1 Tax=Scophthalmus maximus TaxID=52904 RepID=A0A6A4T4U6_SCOMX|nr:hypothetical protein F2P81_008635 [Scophthalmus maximus]